MAKKKKYVLSGIKFWPAKDRPREKLILSGEHSLSDTELIAILLRSGVKGQSALDLARNVYCRFGSFRKMSHTDLRRWKGIKGIGSAKIAQIKAAIEIGRRFREEKAGSRLKIGCSKNAADILMPRMRDLKKEIFKVLLLDSENCLIETIETEEGTVNEAFPVIRDIFQKALQYFAVSIICVHNHPSGNQCPSRQDEDFTKKLSQAGKVLEVKVLDHIIIGDNRYFSFLDANRI